MSESLKIGQHFEIGNRIFTIRGVQVMLDFHLAELYQVETKRLNEQVKRNNSRFPESFMFQLTQAEWNDLQSQFATSKRRTLPYTFIEQGSVTIPQQIKENLNQLDSDLKTNISPEEILNLADS